MDGGAARAWGRDGGEGEAMSDNQPRCDSCGKVEYSRVSTNGLPPWLCGECACDRMTAEYWAKMPKERLYRQSEVDKRLAALERVAAEARKLPFLIPVTSAHLEGLNAALAALDGMA